MQITPDSAVYQGIVAAMEKVINVSGGPEALCKMYRNQTQTRFVWDVFWATNDITYNVDDLHRMGCNDDHIETMLNSICKQHGLIQEQHQ